MEIRATSPRPAAPASQPASNPAPVREELTRRAASAIDAYLWAGVAPLSSPAAG